MAKVDLKSLRTKELSSMNAGELKSFIKSGEKAGYSLSTSKELGKAQNLLKVLEPSRYGKSQVESAKKSLTVNTEVPNLQRLGITDIPDWKMAEQQAKDAGRMQPTATSGMAGGDLTSMLGSFQTGVFDSATSPALREQIAAQLEPQGIAKPEPLNRVNLYNQMREQYGVTGLETAVTDLKAQVEEQVAIKRQRSQAQEAKPVALGVIAGRVGEIERQENERIDALNRQLNTYNDQLNTAYNMVSTFMNYAGLDYQDAVTAYNNEYNKNLQIYKLVDEEMDEQTAQARANLQTFQNAIEKGNITYSQLPSATKSMITKLEVQSGLPAGFTSALRSSDANGKVLSTTTREIGGQKFIDVVMQMPDGSMKVKTQGVGAVDQSSSKLTKDERNADFISRVFSVIESPTGKLNPTTGQKEPFLRDGTISPQDYKNLKKDFMSNTGGSSKDFDDRFIDYANKSYTKSGGASTNWWDDYGIPNPNK